ncbi:MAG: hypothetical protein ACJAU2_000833 [Maribacter sp.]|jgi:hypothetical protein
MVIRLLKPEGCVVVCAVSTRPMKNCVQLLILPFLYKTGLDFRTLKFYVLKSSETSEQFNLKKGES